MRLVSRWKVIDIEILFYDLMVAVAWLDAATASLLPSDEKAKADTPLAKSSCSHMASVWMCHCSHLAPDSTVDSSEVGILQAWPGSRDQARAVSTSWGSWSALARPGPRSWLCSGTVAAMLLIIIIIIITIIISCHLNVGSDEVGGDTGLTVTQRVLGYFGFLEEN